MLIYKATNLVNGKVYIGQTIQTFQKRKYSHFYDAILVNSNLVFHRAIRKYGFDNFKWEIIDTAETQDELNEKETYWIEFYYSYIHTENSNGYNMTFGGTTTSGYRYTEEHKKKVSERHKGKIVSEETKRKSIETRKRNGNLLIGSKSNTAKLTEEDVLHIKEMLKNGERPKEIAEKYSVSRSTIGAIKSGKSWSHLGDDISYIKYTEPNSATKLKENDVIEIKLLLKDGKFSQREIAEKFDVTESTVSGIKKGKSWSLTGYVINRTESKPRLKEHDVVEIRKLIEEGSLTLGEIAKRFNVTYTTISDIKSGKTWKNVK